MLMEKLSSRDWYNRVDDNLIIGAIPFKSMAQLLVDNEVIHLHHAGTVVNRHFYRYTCIIDDSRNLVPSFLSMKILKDGTQLQVKRNGPLSM